MSTRMSARLREPGSSRLEPRKLPHSRSRNIAFDLNFTSPFADKRLGSRDPRLITACLLIVKNGERKQNGQSKQKRANCGVANHTARCIGRGSVAKRSPCIHAIAYFHSHSSQLRRQ